MSSHSNRKRMKKEQREDIDKEEKSLSDYAGDIAGGLSTIFGYDANDKRDYLKEAKGWVYGCVNVIAEEIAGTELFLKKFVKGESTIVDEHDIIDLIYRANNVTTKFDLLKMTFQSLELTGEAPWFISFNKQGQPQSIILLRPDRLTVKPGTNGEFIGGYKYKLYGRDGMKEVQLEPYEVIPIRYTDPDSMIRGKGPLQAVQKTVEIDSYAESFNRKFFKNGATPSAILKTEKTLAKEVRARLEKKLKDNWQGIENAHKAMILEQGLSWENMSLSQKDMDFIEGQKFSRDKILAIFRVPPTVLGLTADVTRANAEATDYVFAKRTIKPKLEGFIQQLNEFLIPLFDKSGQLYLDYADPVPENVDQKIALADGVSKGYLTINEARALFNLDPVDGGDTLRDPLAFSPITNGNNTELVAKKKAKETTSHNNKMAIMARTKKQRYIKKIKDKIQKQIEEKVVPIIYASLKQKFKKVKRNILKVFDGTTPEEVKAKKVEFQSEQLKLADQFEKKIIIIARAIFERQLNTIIGKLEAGQKEPQLNEKDQIDAYTEKLSPILLDIIKQQSRRAFILVGQDNELTKGWTRKATRNQNVAEYLRFYLFELAQDITKTTNEMLGKTLSEGVKNEESVPDLKKRVQTLFTHMEGYRASRIARTEVIRATNFASEEAYKVSGVVAKKEWVTFLDSATDDDCQELDGQTAGLGESFSGGIQYPPVHPNCRCTLVPVVE